jgi:hypothetical protein
MSDVRVKDLDLDQIDQYIDLLNDSAGGGGSENRKMKRTKVKIPIVFYAKSDEGKLIEDPEQPSQPSFVVDISQGGAGVLTGRRLKNGQVFIVKGDGQNKRFITVLKVVNGREVDHQHRYGCTIQKFTLLK